MRPDPQAGVDTPRLHLAVMVGARHEFKAELRARVVLARDVLDFAADRRSTDILVRRNVDHPRLRAERDGRPVLSA